MVVLGRVIGVGVLMFGGVVLKCFVWGCCLLGCRERVVAVLREIVSGGLVGPGDVVVRTGLPRYEVLGVFHVLEALGVVERVYSRGNYRLYSPRPVAVRLLEVLEEGVSDPLEELARRVVGVSASGSGARGESVAEV